MFTRINPSRLNGLFDLVAPINSHYEDTIAHGRGDVNASVFTLILLTMTLMYGIVAI